VLELVEGEYIVAVRSVSNSELVFEGHFPNNPILPGVLIIEAMAQTAGLLAFKTINQTASAQKAYVVAAIDDAKFRRPALPGDQLFIRAHIKSRKRMIWKFGATVHLNSLDGDEVASAVITCAERDLFD
jgi:3-hydroxyacyl-[acyl-carrier-protein] dehydratase